MELSFLYIKEYGRVKDVGLNFLPHFNYQYNSKDNSLSLTKVRDYSDRFYKSYGAKISSVSAIVGQNGVGKSTILRFIKSNFVEAGGGVHAPCLVGIYDRLSDSHYVYHHDIQKPKKDGNNQVEFSIKEISNKKTELKGMEVFQNINAFDEITIINYSGLLDLSPEEQQFMGSYNISTNYLAHKASEKVSFEDKETNFNDVELFRIQEVEKQLNFYSKYKDFLPFEKPDYIMIRLKRFNEFRVRRGLNDDWKKEIDDLAKLKEKKAPQNEIDQKQDRVKFLQEIADLLLEFEKELMEEHYTTFGSEFYKQMFYSFLKGERQYYKHYGVTKEVLSKYFEKIKSENIEKPSEKIRFFFKVNNMNEGQLTEDNQKYLVDYVNLLPLVEKLIEAKANEIYYDGLVYLKLDKQENIDLLLELFEAHHNVNNTGFIDYFWPLSSGQQSLFSLYSRFYDIIYQQSIFANHEIRDNILILLDEAEIGLHPEWQRAFLQDFLKVISEIFKEKNIQLILTTHSPFLLSDLLVSQINFLELDEKIQRAKVVKNPLEEKKSTFGANINTLLQDSFFMKDGFAGTHVLTTLDEFVDHLIYGEVEKLREDSDYIDWFIHQIGEPLIRNKMLQILESRLSTDLLNTNKRLDDIERRLGDVENKDVEDDKD